MAANAINLSAVALGLAAVASFRGELHRLKAKTNNKKQNKNDEAAAGGVTRAEEGGHCHAGVAARGVRWHVRDDDARANRQRREPTPRRTRRASHHANNPSSSFSY